MQGWQAALAMELAPARAGRKRTVLAHCRHSGPLRVQRALYPEEVCHVYLLHPPGGVVGGDSLDIDVAVQPRAHGLITTPAAGKFYRSNQRWAVQRQRCRVAAGGALEWLPQEAILFDQSWSRLETRVDLEGDARFAGWDIVVLGRPAADERFAAGRCVQRFALYRDGRPLWMERNVYEGAAAQMRAPWGLGGHSVSGSFVCTMPSHAGGSSHEAHAARSALLASIRMTMEAWPAADGQRGITCMDDVLVCRFLGDSAEIVRARLSEVWFRLRPHVFLRPAVMPRIWRT